MLKKLKIALFGSEETPKEEKLDDVHLAAAALLMEAAMLDGTVDHAETVKIQEMLASRFDLTGDQVDRLVRAAWTKAEDSVEVYTFTREIKNAFDHEERVHLVEMLWDVAYADGELHDYETNLIRRVCGLVHVADQESGMARKRVEKKLGLA